MQKYSSFSQNPNIWIRILWKDEFFEKFTLEFRAKINSFALFDCYSAHLNEIRLLPFFMYYRKIRMFVVPCELSPHFLPPANEVCEGYVFTPVCQSFCSRGEGSASGLGICIQGGLHPGSPASREVCIGGRGGLAVPFIGHCRIWSTSSQYASYLNAFLLAQTLSHADVALNKVLPVQDITKLYRIVYDLAMARDKCREYTKIHVS